MAKDLRATREYMRAKRDGTLNGRTYTQFKTQRKRDDSYDDALEWYVSGEGMWINQYLRGRMPDSGPLSQNEQKLLNDLDKATQGSIPAQTLYRAVSADAIFGAMDDFEFADLYDHLAYGSANKAMSKVREAKGKTITERGFMSTTSSRELANDWQGFTGSSRDIVLELKVPEGTKGLDVSKNPRIQQYEQARGIESQHETILGRNQSYKVKDVSVKGGNIYVQAEIIKPRKGK